MSARVRGDFPLFPGPAWATLLVLAVVAIGTTLLYRATHREWVELRRAVSALAHGEKEVAARGLAAARQLAAGDPRFEKQLAGLALALGEGNLAREALLVVLKKNPRDGSAASTLAGAYQAALQPQQALHVLLEAREAGATLDEPTQLQLASLYRELKLYPEAEQLYRKLMVSRATGVQASLQLGEMLAWQKHYPESLALLSGLVTAEPGNRQARLAYARALGWSGNSGESVRQYELLLKK